MKNDQENPNFRSGMATIIGRPNVGKSTLLNSILDTKVAIVSKVPQTTRNQIRGILNHERGQIVFIDTPGIHFGGDNLDRYMNDCSQMTIDDADCLIYLVDVSRRIGDDERTISKKLKDFKKPIILGLNKIDQGDRRIPEYIELWEESLGKPVNEMKKFTLLPLSGMNRTNVGKLIEIVFDNLPVGPAYYPSDIITDMPQRMAMADIIREKLFNLMKEELPHSIGVHIELMERRKNNVTYMKVLIYVDREAHKEIVIGKKGLILKQVGMLAREELEALLKSKIFLDLHVKTQRNWRDDLSILTELGYRF